jgi:hypothetical protein
MGLTVLPIEVRDRLADAELTYHELGATRGDLPAGYHQFTKPVPRPSTTLTLYNFRFIMRL